MIDTLKNTDDMKNTVLAQIPQRAPFRFIDEILEVDADTIVGKYTFKKDEWFYQGHFPDRPITPGVILVETMAQTGVVAHGLYLNMCDDHSKNEGRSFLTLFSDVTAEFNRVVEPGTTVIIKGEKVFFRRRKLTSRVTMYSEAGDIIAKATMSGVGVKNDSGN